MARFPLPRGLEGIENLPRTRRNLTNCFSDGNGHIITRPGIELLNTTGRVARGTFDFNGDLYQVASQELLKITDINTGAFVSIGTIEGSDVIEAAQGFNDAVIVVKAVAGKIYALSTSTFFINITSVTDVGGIANFVHAGSSPAVGNTITIKGFLTNTLYNITGIVTFSDSTNFQISSISFGSSESIGSFTLVLSEISGNANFVPSIDVTHINGRFIYVPFDGSPAFFSDVGQAGVVQPLSFFDAEELPDKNNGCFNLGNVLYITGTDSIELFRDSGAVPNPFLRVNGARINNGFIGGLLEYNQTFLFLGREKDQNFGIYSIGQGNAPKISNQAVDFILSTYTITELSEAIPGRIKWRGYDLATFKLARDSIGFFGENWFTLDTILNGSSSPWTAGFINEFEGEYFTAFSDKIGKFAKINSDYGDPLTRALDTGLEIENTDFFACQSLELGISQGFNTGIVVPITSVTDSATLARFNFTAIPNVELAVGQSVTLSGFITNPLYNVTALISATDGTSFFEIGPLLFGTSETTGRFISAVLSIGSVALQLSNNNVNYGPTVFRNLGAIGQYDQKLKWNFAGGLGTYFQFMGIRFTSTDDIDFSSEYYDAQIR